MFSVQPIKDKGLGCIALQDIPKDTLLIRESPLLILTDFEGQTVQQRQQQLEAQLTKDHPFYELCQSHPHLGELGRFVSNCLPIDDDRSAIYPTHSRFNHSCLPNCIRVRDGLDSSIYTLVDVKQGQELMISYLFDGLLLYEQRQAKLQHGLGFKCQCFLCMTDCEESDLRRLRICRLLDKKRYQEALELLEEERIPYGMPGIDWTVFIASHGP